MEYKDIVLPDYNHCILGTITSILKHYNVETNHKSSEVIDKILSEKNFKNIIFIVLDGMGEHILNNISPNGFFNQNKVDCVTSVYPSTTTAALTTYYTGNEVEPTMVLSNGLYLGMTEGDMTKIMGTSDKAFYLEDNPNIKRYQWYQSLDGQNVNNILTCDILDGYVQMLSIEIE